MTMRVPYDLTALAGELENPDDYFVDLFNDVMRVVSHETGEVVGVLTPGSDELGPLIQTDAQAETIAATLTMVGRPAKSSNGGEA